MEWKDTTKYFALGCKLKCLKNLPQVVHRQDPAGPEALPRLQEHPRVRQREAEVRQGHLPIAGSRTGLTKRFYFVIY